MAPKSPPSKRRASSSNTHPLRSSMVGKRKRESDEGFEVRLVKPGSLQPPNNRPKKKRKGNGAGTAPVCRAFIQLNPFGGSLKEVYYNVRSANRWNRMETVDQFTIKGTTFSINQTVFVRPDSSQNTTSAPIESWVAKILEIRVSKPDHAFFRVYWMYRPEDLPGGRQLHHGKSELIASNDMAIIDALTVEKEAAVIYWAEKADESEELEQDGLFWRQTCDVEEGGKLSELSKHCEDEIPWNPDEILVRCESCSKWLHGSCLARKALQEAYESHNVPYPEEDQTTTDEGEAAPPAFTADIGNALSGKIYLTVTDQREENHREYNVAVNCLLCKNTIEGALDEEEKGKEVEKGASEPMQLFENDATSEDTTSASQSEVEPDQSKRDTTLYSTCGQNRTNSGGENMTITVTNQVDPIIPLSALSFKASLGTHIWRQLTDLLTTAQTDVGWLEHIIQFACDVYRSAPHLPHNDNIHLLGILLALHRAEIHIPFEISAFSQLAPSNLPLLPLPAINSIHNGPPTTQALARETSARATHPSQELPLSVRPRPPDNQNPLNGQHHPCAPQDVQSDAIERLGIQISTINDALAAQSHDMRRYKETQEHITKKLGDLQSQLDLQNSKIEDTAVIVTGLQRKLEGLSHDVPIDEVQTTRGISADPGVSGNAQDTALALISEMNMKIGSMQNKIQRLEDEGAVLSAHLYQSPQKPSTHTTQHPPRAAPSYKIPSAHPDINLVQHSQKVHLHDLYDRQSVAATPKTQRADPTQNSRGWVTVNSPAQRAILSSIDEPHYSIRNSTGSPNGLKFTPLEPPVPIPQMAPQTWYSYNSDRQMQTHSHTLSSQAYTISESPHASHRLA